LIYFFKLCNVLFTRELQRRLDAKDSMIAANCFTPGLIVSTGLFREQNPIFTKLFDFAATDLLKVGETPSWGGAALTYMINDVTTKGLYYYSSPGTSSKYGESAFENTQLFGPSDVSVEAQDNVKAQRLWELSEKLLNIKTVI
jgi:protochlorophyllide reductase